MPESAPLLQVCKLLNEANAKYLICGAHACVLHGLVRTTEDVDILVEPTEENCRRVIDGLSKLADGAARDLTPKDILENVVIKIADEVEVDVSTHAWCVSYADAIGTARGSRGRSENSILEPGLSHHQQRNIPRTGTLPIASACWN